MSKPSRKSGVCALCGKFSILTDEHATPRWLGRPLDKHFPPEHRWEAVEYTPGADGRLRQWSKKVDTPAIYKVPILCQPCNGTWGQRLETDAKPLLTDLILGQPVVLGQKEQSLLATWTTKTVLMYEFVKAASEGTTASPA